MSSESDGRENGVGVGRHRTEKRLLDKETEIDVKRQNLSKIYMGQRRK